MDAARLGSGREHCRGFVLREELRHGTLLTQVQLRMRMGGQIRVPRAFKRAADGAPHQAPMARDIDE